MGRSKKPAAGKITKEEKVEYGLVICPNCGRKVPDTIMCIYCAGPIKERPRVSISVKEMEVLSTLKKLGDSRVNDVFKVLGGSRESVRMILSNLVKYGYVNKSGWGRFIVSERGKSVLEEGTKN